MTEIKLDYSIKDPKKRTELVEKITSQASPSQLTPKYLEILADYIVDAMAKEEKHSILTPNRMVTIKKRETSYEELVDKFENGEDGVYNLITEDKNIFLEPKIEITPQDIAEVPGLKELRDQIELVETKAKTATGRAKYLLKKQAIEMRQQQYLLKESYRQPIRAKAPLRGGGRIELDEHITFDANGEPVSDSLVSFFNPDHISALLCNYEILEQGLAHKYSSDFYYLFEDFKRLWQEALKPYPFYFALVKLKIAGRTNAEIQSALETEFKIKHSVEYLSSLWRNKIPKLIAEKAKEEYIIWYYTEVEKGQWKRCSRCGQIKLAHNRFFSKNNTSKDGYYSICKECRNSKTKKGE